MSLLTDFNVFEDVNTNFLHVIKYIFMRQDGRAVKGARLKCKKRSQFLNN